MSLKRELTGDPWQYSNALNQIVDPLKGPRPEPDYSILDRIQGDDDGLIIPQPDAPPLTVEQLARLFGRVEGRSRFSDNIGLNMLSAGIEATTRRTFSREEVDLILLGAHMAISAIYERAETRDLEAQFPDDDQA